MFYNLIKRRFLTNQSAQGPIYILIRDIALDFWVVFRELAASRVL